MSNVISIDPRPTDTRMGPYLVDTGAATETLDNAIGALTLACEAVSAETGTNETLSHSFCAMALALRTLDVLRDTLSEAKSAEALMSDAITRDSAHDAGDTPHPDSLTDEQPEAIAGAALSAQQVKLIETRLREPVSEIYAVATMLERLPSESIVSETTIVDHAARTLIRVAEALQTDIVPSYELTNEVAHG